MRLYILTWNTKLIIWQLQDFRNGGQGTHFALLTHYNRLHAGATVLAWCKIQKNRILGDFWRSPTSEHMKHTCARHGPYTFCVSHQGWHLTMDCMPVPLLWLGVKSRITGFWGIFDVPRRRNLWNTLVPGTDHIHFVWLLFSYFQVFQLNLG